MQVVLCNFKNNIVTQTMSCRLCYSPHSLTDKEKTREQKAHLEAQPTEKLSLSDFGKTISHDSLLVACGSSVFS